MHMASPSAHAAASYMIVVVVVVLTLAPAWNLAEVAKGAGYDGTVLGVMCSTEWDDSRAMRDEIKLITDTLINQTNPRPPPEYLCAVPYQGDPPPYAWGGASCSDRVTKADCGDCLARARDALMSSAYCAGRPGAHMYMQDCALRYENYEFCRG